MTENSKAYRKEKKRNDDFVSEIGQLRYIMRWSSDRLGGILNGVELPYSKIKRIDHIRRCLEKGKIVPEEEE